MNLNIFGFRFRFFHGSKFGFGKDSSRVQPIIFGSFGKFKVHFLKFRKIGFDPTLLVDSKKIKVKKECAIAFKIFFKVNVTSLKTIIFKILAHCKVDKLIRKL